MQTYIMGAWKTFYLYNTHYTCPVYLTKCMYVSQISPRGPLPRWPAQRSRGQVETTVSCRRNMPYGGSADCDHIMSDHANNRRGEEARTQANNKTQQQQSTTHGFGREQRGPQKLSVSQSCRDKKDNQARREDWNIVTAGL